MKNQKSLGSKWFVYVQKIHIYKLLFYIFTFWDLEGSKMN